MTDSGLMASASAPLDRRTKLLVPTEALIAHDLDMLAALAAPCAVLGKHPAYELALACDRRMQRAHRVVSVDAFGEALQMMMRHPEMMMIFHRDSGYMVLLSLLQSALASSRGTVSSVPYQDIADRFGISRSHVRNLVEDAEKAGLMRIDGQGGSALSSCCLC